MKVTVEDVPQVKLATKGVLIRIRDGQGRTLGSCGSDRPLSAGHKEACPRRTRRVSRSRSSSTT